MSVRNRKDQNANGYRKLIQSSMQKVIETGSVYEAARHGVTGGEPGEEDARIGHHIAIMELFSVLRPYLSSVQEIRSDYWDGREISAEAPHGLRHLSSWRTKSSSMTRKDESPFSSRGDTKSARVARALEPRKAFAAADALLGAAHELGFAPEPDLGLPHDETTLEDLKGRSPLSTIALEDPDELEEIRSGEKKIEIEESYQDPVGEE